jgi:hypothetical protein
MRVRAAWLMLGLETAMATFGCKSRVTAAPVGASAAPAGSSVASVMIPVSAPSTSPLPTSTVQLPEGPILAIQPGQGVGPIRIGATVATIERLMAAPCEVKTPDVCRYIVRAVEFDLSNGVTQRIIVHRHDRPAGPDAKGQPQVYGFFNGGIPPGAGLGMIPEAVFKIIGPPQSLEKVSGTNDNNTVERAIYPGMVLEFDTYKNGRVMLGAVIISMIKR